MLGFYLDPRYILYMAPGIILMLLVQWYVSAGDSLRCC
jgi:preprotein translocase subunit Sec61beta